jgi:hypothetical protein
MSLICNLRYWASRHKTFLFLLFALVATCLIHSKSITQPPVSKHAWAQSDWYALSLGFLDNGMDLFHPQTYVLFPLPGGSQDIPKGITAADFPVHPYLAACLMKLTGYFHPVVFRTLSFLLSLTGLLFFFFALKRYSNSVWLAVTGMCFFLFQPTFAYYQDGFIPSIHAFSHYLIGLFFLSDYFSKRKNKTLNFALAILFFTIAALTRLPYLIHLLAILIVILLISWKMRQYYFHELSLVAIGLIIVSCYFLYNRYLAEIYGSLFLNHYLPASSIRDFFSCILESVRNNIRTVFPPVHLLLLVLFGYLVIRSVRQNSVNPDEKNFLNYIVISFIGVFCYIVLMMKQFPAHDYYMLDTLCPVIASTFILGSRFIKYPPGINHKLIILFFIIGSFNVCLEYQLRLYSKERLSLPELQTINNFEGSDEFLEKHGIPKDRPVLVVGSYEPNIPFIQLKRQGFQVRDPKHDNIREALKIDYECAITQNSFFSEITEAFPEWNKTMESFATNGKITLWHYAVERSER